MYKHIADSIKESSDRMFISSEEKTKFNNYENTMRRKDDSYSKEEVDNKVNQIKNKLYESVECSHNSIDNTLDGYLEDVEILGNTVQDASNLADIRSVGDKVEGQELYEIPVLSCGKNLFNGEYEEGYISIGGSTNGQLTPSANFRSTKFIEVKQNTTYTMCYVNRSATTFYDKNKVKVGESNALTFTTNENTYYVRIYYYNANISEVTNKDNFQLEEGTVATPYEPYQEDKLTILSPVQLEKVGGVADRIIEKDGVWGVEKNVGTLIVDGKSDVNDVSTSGANCDYFTVRYSDGHSLVSVETHGHFSAINSYGLPVLWNMVDEKHLYLEKKGLRVYTDKGLYSDTTSAKNYLDLNTFVLKAQLKEPQFIPLPHDQQLIYHKLNHAY